MDKSKASPSYIKLCQRLRWTNEVKDATDIINLSLSYLLGTCHDHLALVGSFAVVSLFGDVLSRVQDAATPDNLIYECDKECPTREEIYNGALEGQGLELGYSANRIDPFMMEVQGSGFVHFGDDDTLQYFAYAGLAVKVHHYGSAVMELMTEKLSSNVNENRFKLHSDCIECFLERKAIEFTRIEQYTFLC
eukprot:snap_masked-scaffold1227_size54431-processed-gene-0.0 protein:Tk01353 transcript:snap_masked-scaffold1227_size54431-processed-gene-0.0-mRNA-1 annotation:"murein transglycosylase"